MDEFPEIRVDTAQMSILLDNLIRESPRLPQQCKIAEKIREPQIG